MKGAQKYPDRLQILNICISSHRTQFFPSGIPKGIQGIGHILKDHNKKNLKRRFNFNERNKKSENLYLRNLSKNTRLCSDQMEINDQEQIQEQKGKKKVESMREAEEIQIDRIVEEFLQIGLQQPIRFSYGKARPEKRRKIGVQQKKSFLKTSVIMEQVYSQNQNRNLATIFTQIATQVSSHTPFLNHLFSYNWHQIFSSQDLFSLLFQLAFQTKHNATKVEESGAGKKIETFISSWSQGMTEQMGRLFFQSDCIGNGEIFEALKQYFMLFKHQRNTSMNNLRKLSEQICEIKKKNLDRQSKALLCLIDPLADISHFQNLVCLVSETHLFYFLLYFTLFWLGISSHDHLTALQDWKYQKINLYLKLTQSYRYVILKRIPLNYLTIFLMSNQQQSEISNNQINLFNLFFLSTPLAQKLYHLYYLPSQFIHPLQQIYRNLLQISNKFQFQNYIIGFLPFLSSQLQISVLTSQKQLVQNLDWNLIAKYQGSFQLTKPILREVALKSIRFFQNAEKFINLDLPLELKPCSFQIDVLIQGLLQVLTEGKTMTDSDKNNYFGVLSILRSVSIPVQSGNSFSFLEALFEWFVLEEGIIRRDIKSIGVSLSFNLEQIYQNELNSSFSMKITQSMQMKTSKLHNSEILETIWTKNFIQWTINQNYWPYFILYLNCIADALFLIQRMKQRIIKTQKIDKWKANFVKKINEIQRFIYPELLKSFTEHRKRLLQRISS